MDIVDNGLYALVDSDNVAYVNVGATIHALGLKDAADPARGIAALRGLDASAIFPPISVLGQPPAVKLAGVAMTDDGHLVLASESHIRRSGCRGRRYGF